MWLSLYFIQLHIKETKQGGPAEQPLSSIGTKQYNHHQMQSSQIGMPLQKKKKKKKKKVGLGKRERGGMETKHKHWGEKKNSKASSKKTVLNFLSYEDI